MDINQLITDLQEISKKNSISHYKRDRCAEAATALSTLQEENEQLRAERDQARTDCAVAEKNHADCAEELEKRQSLFEDVIGDMPVDRLRELKQADDEGRCVVLPCKVGDTVYQVDDIRVYALEVRNLIYDAGILAFDESAIGKTVFLTREDAEAALRREQDGE